MRRPRHGLSVVPSEAPPAPEPAPPQDPPKDIYAEARHAALDSERWRRMHEISDRAPAISLARSSRRLFSMKGGVRRESGGHKFEERA